MTKEEFLKFWVKNPNELMPNPENRHKAVVIKDLFLKQLDEIISEAIASHEVKHEKLLIEANSVFNHVLKYYDLIDKDEIWRQWKDLLIAFRELPDAYQPKEGGEGLVPFETISLPTEEEIETMAKAKPISSGHICNRKHGANFVINKLKGNG